MTEHQLARLGSCLTPWSAVAALAEGSRPASPVNDDLYRSVPPAGTHTDPRHPAFLFAWSGAWKGQAVFKLTSRRNVATIPDSQKTSQEGSQMPKPTLRVPERRQLVPAGPERALLCFPWGCSSHTAVMKHTHPRHA